MSRNAITKGAMNLIVNAHDAKESTPELKAIALRVRDAGQAWAHAPRFALRPPHASDEKHWPE